MSNYKEAIGSSADKLTYPSYLTLPSYMYRSLTITIKSSLWKTSDAKATVDYVKKIAKEVAAVKDKTSAVELSEVFENAKESREVKDKIHNDTSKTVKTIVLPLPNELTDTQSHSWSQEDGIAKSLADKLAPGLMGVVDAVVSKGSNALGARKPMLSPGFFQNYSGSSTRSFSLSFDLIPENRNDAGEIYMILQTLRKFSLPTEHLGVAMLAPHYFSLDFSNGYIDTLINAKELVLTDVSTNYSGDGTMQQTMDGMPKHIKLDLTFSDRRPLTSADY